MVLGAPTSESIAVPLSRELRRIVEAPRRRVPTEAQQQEMAAELTQLLRADRGRMDLRPMQGWALTELGALGGCFGVMRVGSGKTLVSFLAPVVTGAQRPLLLYPAALRAKTQHDWDELKHHWKLPNYLRKVSYELLSRERGLSLLHDYRPDLIIADEAHSLKSPIAACTGRFFDYCLAHTPMCLLMSGTFTKRSILDYTHLLWCVYRHALKKPTEAMQQDEELMKFRAMLPVPRTYSDAEIWADAIDERKGQQKRADPGALAHLCDGYEKVLWSAGQAKKAARLAYQRRLLETPGVVATKATKVDASIVVKAVEPSVAPVVDQAFDTLRSLWETPDGWECLQAMEVWRHARELALGLYYVWDPRPPADWLAARKAWAQFVRYQVQRRVVTEDMGPLDTPGMIKKAFQGHPLLTAWEAIEPTFKPNTEARWIDFSVAQWCAKWLKRNRGILWTEHVFFAEKVAALSGISFYGEGGLNVDGRPIEKHPTGQSLIAQIGSNKQGRNLQAWNKNLIASSLPNGLWWEQLMGRTHREGQQADEVIFELVCTCFEHAEALWQSRRDAVYSKDTLGSGQKLLEATITVPKLQAIAGRPGPRWNKWPKAT